MKRFALTLLICLLAGCQTTNRPIESPEPLPFSSHEEWTFEKGYFLTLSTLAKNYNPYNNKYTYDVTDQKLILNQANSSLTYEIETQLLSVHLTDEFNYVRNNELKRGTLEYQFTYDKDNPVIEGTFSNQSEIYPIAFDWNTQTITDNEEGSETLGKPMKFIQAVKDRIVHEFIQTYNQLTLQKQVLDQWYQLALSITSNDQIQNIQEASEILLDESQLLVSSYARENILTYEVTPRVISIDKDFFISLHEADALQKTLFIAANIAAEFHSAEEIEWNDVLVPVLGISENRGGCEGLECVIHKKTVYLNYSHQNGYLALAHLDDLNKTVQLLSGLENVYQPEEDQSHKDDALYDAEINSYIVGAPDGEFVNRDPGIIVIHQSSSENQITIDFIIYQPVSKDNEYYVGNFYLADAASFSNEMDIMQAAYDLVKTHSNDFDHWQLTLEKQDAPVYHLVSMKKTN